MDKEQLPSSVELVKKLTGATEIKETHISYAILGDEFVYKIKKPVDFGFLDYKLLKSRRTYTILEKELNDRFSKDIYIEAMKIVRQSKDTFALVPVENSLAAIEYVLKMKRIKDDDFLATRINLGLINYDDMVNIGKQVASLLKNLENAPKDEDFKEPFDSVKFNAIENFNQTEKYAGNFIDKSSYDYIKDKTIKFLDSNRDIFNKRFDDGFIKNGHGDLRLEHIYFNDDNSIGLIDCIEFNRRFRYIDVISEAAFLSMELDIAGQIELSDGFLAGFLHIFNDKDTLKLINYYKCYLSYVRAKVTCFFLDGIDENHNLYENKREEVNRLIDLSSFYAYSINELNTLIFYGLMGSGKSKNANAFSKRFPVYYINSDKVRKNINKISLNKKVYENFGEGLYSPEISQKVYEDMANTVIFKNNLGRSCIIDASFSKKDYHNKYINVIKNKKFIKFTAPDDVILSRLNKRLSKNVVSDGRPELYFKQKEVADFPKEDILIDTCNEVSENIDKIYKELINK